MLNGEKDVSIEIIDSESAIESKEFAEKVIRFQGGDDELKSEANRAFRPYAFNNPDDIF